MVLHTPESNSENFQPSELHELVDIDIKDRPESTIEPETPELTMSLQEDADNGDKRVPNLENDTTALMRDDIPTEKTSNGIIKEEATKTTNDNNIAAEKVIEHDSGHPLSKLEKSLQLRDKLDALIRRTVQTKKKCDKLDHDNKYLQEYVGNLMNSGELLYTKK